MSTTDTTQTFTGRCLCGEITFSGTIDQSAAGAVHCHCKDCQRATGSGSATVIGVPEANLVVRGTLGEFAVRGASGGTVIREFCPNCGSPMFTRAALSEGLRFVKAGVLDDSSWVAAVLTCWTDQRPAWAVLAGDVPELPANP